MAQAIKADKVTPADELRDLLTRSEKRIVSLQGGPAALQLLLDLDRISELWPELEAQGADLRPELGRWETLQAGIRRRAARLVREMQAVGGLPAARARYHPGDQAGWWWFLAEQVGAQRASRLRRNAILVGGILALAVGLYFLIFHVLFPVDPALSAALSARNAGERKITEESDFAGALADFRRVTELRPADAEGWLWTGCTLLKLGETAAAAADFDRAWALVGDEVASRLARATICIRLGLLDTAEEDLRVVLAAEPEEPSAHYLLAGIYETRQQFSEAIALFERASALAEARKDYNLSAMARVRIGMLLQQTAGLNVMGPTPTP